MFASRRQLNGKLVAITGGSRGIGLVTAETFIRAGARVAIGARDLDHAVAVAKRIGAHAYRLDVTESQSMQAFWHQVEDGHGPIDIMVNNAGNMIVGPFEQESEEVTAHQIAVNLIGVINGMKVALPHMRQRGQGQVITNASAVGRLALPGIATYCAAKHGVVGLSESLRAELRGTKVDITVVLPLPAKTELTSGVGEGRFVSRLEPGDIAKAIVGSALRPRFQVFVPGWTNPLSRLLAVVPQGVREALGGLFKADQLLRTTDYAAREAYERRVMVPTRSGS